LYGHHVEGDQGDRLREQPVLSVDEAGTALVVRLGGDLDLYNAEQVRAALAGAADRRPSRIVVDLSEVEFIDSTALGVLIEAHRNLGGDGFHVASPQTEVGRALQISGVDRHLKVHDSVDAALTA
jgi:anti-anti-sigma factor